MAVIEIVVPLESIEYSIREKYRLEDSVEITSIEHDGLSDEIVLTVDISDDEFDLVGTELLQAGDWDSLEGII